MWLVANENKKKVKRILNKKTSYKYKNYTITPLYPIGYELINMLFKEVYGVTIKDLIESDDDMGLFSKLK